VNPTPPKISDIYINHNTDRREKMVHFHRSSSWRQLLLVLVAAAVVVDFRVTFSAAAAAAAVESDTIVDGGYASEYGYVDLSFQCDVRVTCPLVCASSFEECPDELKCLERDETLCKDGSCAVFCSNDLFLYSPCEEISACAPVTCASIDMDHDACYERFNAWYVNATDCPTGGDEQRQQQQDIEEFAWLTKEYIAVYCWMSGMTIAIISWCWYK
jgi:hypothetical protein